MKLITLLPTRIVPRLRMRGDTPPFHDMPLLLVQGRPLFHEALQLDW